MHVGPFHGHFILPCICFVIKFNMDARQFQAETTDLPENASYTAVFM